MIRIVKPKRGLGYNREVKKVRCFLYDSRDKRGSNLWWFRNFISAQRLQPADELYIFGNLVGEVCELSIDEAIEFVDTNVDAGALMHLEIFANPMDAKLIKTNAWKEFVLSNIGIIRERNLTTEEKFRFVCVVHSSESVPHVHIIYKKPDAEVGITLKSMLSEFEYAFNESLNL